MLVLGAENANVRGGGLGVLQGILRFDDGDLVGDAGLVLRFVVIEGLFVGDDRIIEDLLQGILPAELKIEHREAGLLAETFVFQIRGAQLGVEAGHPHRFGHLSPEIGFPGNIQSSRDELVLRLELLAPLVVELVVPLVVLPMFVDAVGRNNCSRGSSAATPGLNERSHEALKVRWIELRRGFPHQSARFHVILEELLDVLVVDIELRLERIQFRVLEDLPPIPTQHGIGRPRDFPIGVLEMGGRFLVTEVGGLRIRWRRIGWRLAGDKSGRRCTLSGR